MTLRIEAAKRKTPEKKPASIGSAMQGMLDKYRQDYLNMRARNELPSRIAFAQPSNNGSYLKVGRGRYGRGAYAKGQIIDRNKENMPKIYQHSTSPELILPADKFTTEAEAKAAGYVGVNYEDDLFFLFEDTVPQKVFANTTREQTTFTHTHPVTGDSTDIKKSARRWNIDGVNINFRTKEKAIAFLEQDIPM